MDHQLKSILSDLYAIDPLLKQDEQQLITIVKKLLESRPNTKFNQQFARQLRAQLLESAAPMPKLLIPNLFTIMNKYTYAFGGALITALVVLPVIYVGWFLTSQSPSIGGGDLSLKPEITQLADQAFGPLQAQQNASPQPEATKTMASLGAGSSQPTAPLAMNVGFGGGGGTASRDMAVASPGMIIAPQPYVQYRYVYKGEALKLPGEKLPVFKRLVGSGGALNQLAGGLNLGLIDLNTFTNTKLEQLSFYEDKNGGLRVGINFTDNSINIYEGPDYSGQPVTELQPKDMPDDQALIAIADQFLTRHNIKIDGFGAPEVRSEWRLYYAAATKTGTMPYVPNVITVVYPFIVSGQTLYDQSGLTSGLTVNIDVSRKKATGLWNLRTQQYQSSLYQMETDASRILKLAENGGPYPIYNQEGATLVDIELGTPTLALVQMYDYQNNQSIELLVPSLIFPVTKAPTDGPYPFFQQNVVIPLAKDILDRNVDGGGPIKIMPLGQPGVSGGSAGVAPEPAQTEPAPAPR